MRERKIAAWDHHSERQPKAFAVMSLMLRMNTLSVPSDYRHSTITDAWLKRPFHLIVKGLHRASASEPLV
jgi:hypothetical protein